LVIILIVLLLISFPAY
ncbi:type I toxin-antitoxin system Ibs family toxin, partial [Escherichia coli]